VTAAEQFDFPALEPDGPLFVTGATPTERAAEIVQLAHASARQVKAEAEAAGRTAGEAAGLAEARERLADAESALDAAVRGFAQTEDECHRRAEERAVELALSLAAKIVATAFDADPSRVLEVVRGTLRRLAERDGVVIEVNPSDHDLVAGAMSDIAERLGGMHRFEVVAERRVERGGCIVRTVEGELDAQPSAQLERAAEVLRDAVRAGGGGA